MNLIGWENTITPARPFSGVSLSGEQLQNFFFDPIDHSIGLRNKYDMEKERERERGGGGVLRIL